VDHSVGRFDTSPALKRCTGHHADHLLTFEHWQHVFGNPDAIAADR
jgi:hypothetical protein